MTQIRQLRRGSFFFFCKHLLDEHFIPVVSETASLTQRYNCCQHISHHGRSDTNSKKETYLNLRAGRRQERNTATNEHIILKEPQRRSLSRTKISSLTQVRDLPWLHRPPLCPCVFLANQSHRRLDLAKGGWPSRHTNRSRLL